MAIAQEFGSNRFYFYDPSKIDIEYSRNAGETWLDYGATDKEKFDLTSMKGISRFYIGKWVSGETFDPSWRLRITFNNPIGNNEIYGSLNMFIINASTSGATGTHITLKGYNGNNQVINTYIDSNWSGWSGYNSYYPNAIIFGGGSSQLSQCFKLEFEFWVDNHTGTSAPTILNIFAYGPNLWAYKNSLVNWGHLYKIDINKNACFPSSLYVNNVISTTNKLLSSSEVDSKIEESWTWGEYD